MFATIVILSFLVMIAVALYYLHRTENAIKEDDRRKKVEAVKRANERQQQLAHLRSRALRRRYEQTKHKNV